MEFSLLKGQNRDKAPSRGRAPYKDRAPNMDSVTSRKPRKWWVI